jgi:hypothetical protein
LTPADGKKKRELTDNPADSFVRASEILTNSVKDGPTFDSVWGDDPWYDSSLEEALRIKNQLLKEHQGASLSDVIEGEVIENEFGSCYKIDMEYTDNFCNLDEGYCTQEILSNLRLVCGIGPEYEGDLMAEGYSSILELLKHPKWGFPAKEFLEVYEDGDISSLHEWMWRFFPRSHRLLYLTSGFFRPEDFIVFDIETMGLFEAPIILFGLGKQIQDGVRITQYLLTDIYDEPAALLETIKELKSSKAIISYNGRSFDVPYLKDRLAFYGLDIIEEGSHYDLLHYTRRFIGNLLPRCTLGDVERYLGIERGMDLPSSMVPDFYEKYLETGNPGPLIPIVEHNKQDLITLVSLFNRFHEDLT